MEVKRRIADVKKLGGTDAIIETYFEYSHLKNLYRQGWLRAGIRKIECESVADHCFGVAILSLFIAEQFFPELNASKLIKIALLHEFGEVYGGDITPVDEVSAKDKKAIEKKSVIKVLSKLKKGNEYIGLWKEYAEGISKEARFVKQIDKLEMAFQAGVYETAGYGNLQEFTESAKERITLPKLNAFISKMRRLVDRQ
jgi:putative hydrolases of HD superfamily